MEAAKKAALEKRIVIGLLCLFGVTFAGALKPLGVFGPAGAKRPVTRVQETVRIQDTLVETMQEHWKNMEPQPDPQTAASAAPVRASAAPAYTAQGLRDPMTSLLPEATPPGAEMATAQQGAVPAAVPPPVLMVRGVLWGGREPQAIINDDVYRVGETVEGAKILSIDPSGVTIEYQGAPAFYSTAAPLAAERSRSQQAQWR